MPKIVHFCSTWQNAPLTWAPSPHTHTHTNLRTYLGIVTLGCSISTVGVHMVPAVACLKKEESQIGCSWNIYCNTSLSGLHKCMYIPGFIDGLCWPKKPMSVMLYVTRVFYSMTLHIKSNVDTWGSKSVSTPISHASSRDSACRERCTVLYTHIHTYTGSRKTRTVRIQKVPIIICNI